ncbi:MAG: N-6 DNA methylase [Bacteroidota bacterium]|nr:N-6 DNA methylase [Bacteroidota bacterium]
MPTLSWNEIKDRAVKFSKEWENDFNEDAEAKSFMDEFFTIFGTSRRRIGAFEKNIKKEDGKQGFIDFLWKGMVLIEFKSKGKDLDKAHKQAKDYFPGLKDNELPKYILVSDFARFRLYDIEEDKTIEFELKDLVNNVQHFGFIAGYQKKIYREQDQANIKAAELMGKLHDRLKEIGYDGHPLEIYLVRLLFCLFAEDTTIFNKQQFQDYIEQRTNEDGSDLAPKLQELFQVLNTAEEKRFKNLDEQLAEFRYVNGKLFEEQLPTASFDSKMRQALLDCCYLDWSKISPAIFGSMFQSVMNPGERRNLGAHYTSEKNILKLIKPLFLDELKEEFESIKINKNKLPEFHRKLSSLKFLDPACGCGNFLIITYRELRFLEIEVLEAIQKGQQVTDIRQLILIDVDQMYGIEYKEFPARIAEVAMWLIDHQMNMLISNKFGDYFARLPLKKSPTIVHGNALQIDWASIISKKELSYIIGNPPFIGKQVQSSDQKKDMEKIFEGLTGGGTLDYVSAWFIKAAQYIQDTKIKVAFVSTNSISQGEQVGIVWGLMFTKYKIKIHFAHRTFKWGNEAKGNAAVHVVIIGLANFDINEKRIFEYEDIKGEAHEIKAKNINPYLVEGKDIFISTRTTPLCNVPEIIKGSETTDDGHFMLTLEEVNQLKEKYPQSSKFIRPFIGGGDFINGKIRYCLWLKDSPLNEIRQIPLIQERIERVKNFRLASNKARTRHWANFPTLFSEDRQPKTRYLVFPKVSSERRAYIPFAFVEPEFIINNTASFIPEASLYHFGILESKMHMAWTGYVCGRMKSDFIYSNKIVYNNYPWAENVSDKQKASVERAAENVLKSRMEFPKYSLADLYDPFTMPPSLAKAHQELDKAVDLCYRPQPFVNAAKRIEFLFELYEKYTADLFTTEKVKKVKKK